MTDSSSVYHQLTLCTLVGLALRELREKGNNFFFLSVETTGAYIKTYIVEVPQI
jgi:hypothetical protein